MQACPMVWSYNTQWIWAHNMEDKYEGKHKIFKFPM